MGGVLATLRRRRGGQVSDSAWLGPGFLVRPGSRILRAVKSKRRARARFFRIVFAWNWYYPTVPGPRLGIV